MSTNTLVKPKTTKFMSAQDINAMIQAATKNATRSGGDPIQTRNAIVDTVLAQTPIETQIKADTPGIIAPRTAPIEETRQVGETMGS